MEEQVNAGFGKKFPPKLYTIRDLTVKGSKSDQLGLRVSSTCMVTKVDRGSVWECCLQFGDLLLRIDGNRVDKRKHALDAFKKVTQGDYKLSLTIARLKTKLPLQSNRLPRDYDSLGGFKYHAAVMYMLKGSRLGLPVKSYNNKVYVTRVMEYTLSSMCLAVGDAIVDVDNHPVTSVEQTSSLLFERLKSRGYVTMAVEQAADPAAAQFVRMALSAEKTVNLDHIMAQDTIDIARAEIKRMQMNDIRIPPASILKERRHTSKGGHVSFATSSELHPIASETNPSLLIHVVPQRLQNPLLITEGVVVGAKSTAVTSALQQDNPEGEIIVDSRSKEKTNTDDRTERNEQLSEPDIEAEQANPNPPTPRHSKSSVKSRQKNSK